MARVIECDRCERVLKAEAELYFLDFTPPVANNKAHYELCQPCFDEIHAKTKQAPPEAA